MINKNKYDIFSALIDPVEKGEKVYLNDFDIKLAY